MRKTLFILTSFAALSLPAVAVAEGPPASGRQTTVTGSNGGGFTSTTTGSRDHEAGVWQRDTNTAFNNGRPAAWP